MQFDAKLFGRPQKSVNKPNWTGGCTKHGVRVAKEVKHLMRAQGGPSSTSAPLKTPSLGGKIRQGQKNTIELRPINRTTIGVGRQRAK